MKKKRNYLKLQQKWKTLKIYRENQIYNSKKIMKILVKQKTNKELYNIIKNKMLNNTTKHFNMYK